MTITNDKVQFDPTDFDDLSDFAKKALTVFVGERLEFQNFLAEAVNGDIEAAKNALVNLTTKDESTDKLIRQLAAADAKKLADAAPLLAQLDDILK